MAGFSLGCRGGGYAYAEASATKTVQNVPPQYFIQSFRIMAPIKGTTK